MNVFVHTDRFPCLTPDTLRRVSRTYVEQVGGESGGGEMSRPISDKQKHAEIGNGNSSSRGHPSVVAVAFARCAIRVVRGMFADAVLLTVVAI